MKKIFSLFLASLLALSLAACGNSAQDISSTASSQDEKVPSFQESASSTPEQSSAPEEPMQTTQRQISVHFGESVVYYELNDSQAATDLYDQLPLTLQVEDFSTNEKIFYPTTGLDTADAPLAEGGAGTLAYYAPWSDVVMFYGDFNANDSLYALGQVVSGEDLISGMSGTITIDKSEASGTVSTQNAQGTQIKITAGGQEMTAVLEDNVTTRALLEQLPLTISMNNLFSREMAYYFEEALPTNNLISGGYEAGDIVYWPPKNSLAIFYANDGSSFERQNLGRILSGYEVFEGTGDMQVTLELIGN